ncbi:MAG: hypothetical protein JZU67_06040 [Burkholderiaceae bacterium]|nr:hypothetical protein [Burkholderiaceae bacterium]
MRERIRGCRTFGAVLRTFRIDCPIHLKACILGCLLPTTDDPTRDLEIFEMLMGMDFASLEFRLEEKNDKLSRFILNEHRSVDHHAPYREWVQASCRPEECGDELFSHIWEEINAHLGTRAYSFPELVEQLGIMRFGHRPRMADTFCGSGQIPFEAARLGCDVYASDLNPVACMLTWGALNIIGGSQESRNRLSIEQQKIRDRVQNAKFGKNVSRRLSSWTKGVIASGIENVSRITRLRDKSMDAL